MAFMIPPNADTQIIMTMTQLPAEENPVSSSLSHDERSHVPASSPHSSDESMPAPRHSSVCIPIKLMTITISIGMIM